MAKKKHYEYRETSNHDNREFGEKARSHRLKPNDRWRYNPNEVYKSLDQDDDYGDYDDNEEYANWK
jgi:hypothetical protein